MDCPSIQILIFFMLLNFILLSLIAVCILYVFRVVVIYMPDIIEVRAAILSTGS